MTKEEVRERNFKTKPCRFFMIIAYDKNNPDEKVWGYNPKRNAFYFGKGFPYSYRGKQKPDMLNGIILDLSSVKKNMPNFFSEDKLEKVSILDLEFKIIRISSTNSPYYATKLNTKDWYPNVYIYPKGKLIDWFKTKGKSEKDAYVYSMKVLQAAHNSTYNS